MHLLPTNYQKSQFCHSILTVWIARQSTSWNYLKSTWITWRPSILNFRCRNSISIWLCTDHSVQRRFKSNAPTDWISQHWSRDRVNASALVSSCRAPVWTVIRADKRSVWRDSNESRGFVPLLAHKHYIEHFSNFLYRFRGKLYRDNYRYRIIAQP